MTLNRPFLAAFCLASLASQVAALSVSAPRLETYGHNGEPPGGPCTGAFLSGNARYLSYSCASDDIVVGDLNERYDSFLLDRTTRQVRRASVDSNGTQYRYNSTSGFPSDNGDIVVFMSNAPLHPDLDFPYPSGGYSNAFVHDFRNGQTELVGRSSSGQHAITGHTQLQGAVPVSSLALFLTNADMLSPFPSPFSPTYHLYVRSWANGNIELVTATPKGTFSAIGSGAGSTISPDGRFVAFASGADDLGPANPTQFPQLYLRDLQTRTTRRLSFPFAGGEFTQPFWPGIYDFSTDGRYLAVDSASDEITPDNAPFFVDVYVVDTATARWELVSKGPQGQPANDSSFSISISGDGRFVAFFSRATNLLPSAQSSPAIYVKDRINGQLLNISAPLDAPFPGHIPRVRFSENGAAVVFDWRHPVTHPQLANRTLIYAVDIRGGQPLASVPIPALGPAGMLLAIGTIVLLARLRLSWRRSNARLAIGSIRTSV